MAFLMAAKSPLGTSQQQPRRTSDAQGVSCCYGEKNSTIFNTLVGKKCSEYFTPTVYPLSSIDTSHHTSPASPSPPPLTSSPVPCTTLHMLTSLIHHSLLSHPHTFANLHTSTTLPSHPHTLTNLHLHHSPLTPSHPHQPPPPLTPILH